MARLKKVYTDPEYTRDKKRERIRKLVASALIVCWITGLFIMGIHQDDPCVVGFGLVIEGIVSLAYVVFAGYTYAKRWRILTLYDQPDFWRFRIGDSEGYRKAQKESKAMRLFEDIICAVIGLFMLIFGILRLTGVA